MRVICNSIAEFFANLAEEHSIFAKTVRVSITRRSLDTKPVREAVKVNVLIQASTVVLVDENSQYLLEAAQDCGIDYNDASQGRGGTDQALEFKKQIEEFVKERGWKVLPGMISE